jgi:transglutaminase-like putative cysteine protease
MYGNPKWLEMWVARGVFQNDTSETLSDYRARFRIEGYSSWSPWKRTDKVFPGQTVVDAFYPIIDGKIAHLKGSTPAQVELEYEYTRPGGEKLAETEAGRTKLLGMNEAVWSSLATDEDSTWYDVFRNAQMVLASFTSATDPVVQDVVGLIGKATGGAATSLSDQDALKFMGTLYNLFRQNIAYETTPGGYQDGLLHQHLKYGRDVLRTRSGTCVNLSILYASVCEAAGLNAYIVLGPGHAFAAAKLPKSGLPVFVETTGCGGGTKESSMTFVQAREQAFKTYQKWYADGLMIETDIEASRQKGVPSPELPDLGVNPLKEWGIQQPESVDQVYLPKLLVNVKSALDAAQLKYSALAGKPSVQLNFKTQQENEWITIVQTDEDAEIMAVMSFVPGQVPENQRQAVAVALADYNTGFLHGNFDLSKAGLISYRTSTHVRGGLLAAKMVQNEIDTHFNFMQKYLPELRKLVSTPARTNQQQTAGSQPAPTPVPAEHPLVGKWKTAYRDGYGNLIAQVSLLRADGTFVQLAATGNGASVQLKGRWSYKDNYLTAVYENQQTLRGPLKFINKNRVVFHDPSFNMDLTYDRVEEK